MVLDVIRLVVRKINKKYFVLRNIFQLQKLRLSFYDQPDIPFPLSATFLPND